jgi:crotonobetaine/carnitine-CoA ligase
MLTVPHFTPTFPVAQWTLPAVLEHQARHLGDRPFLRWEDDGPFLTFAEINRPVNRLANGLRAIGDREPGSGGHFRAEQSSITCWRGSR